MSTLAGYIWANTGLKTPVHDDGDGMVRSLNGQEADVAKSDAPMKISRICNADSLQLTALSRQRCPPTRLPDQPNSGQYNIPRTKLDSQCHLGGAAPVEILGPKV